MPFSVHFLSVDRVFGADNLKGSFSPIWIRGFFRALERDINRKELIVENFHHKFILVDRKSVV